MVSFNLPFYPSCKTMKLGLTKSLRLIKEAPPLFRTPSDLLNAGKPVNLPRIARCGTLTTYLSIIGLPVEIIYLIFEYVYYSHTNPNVLVELVLSHICGRFRDIALGFSPLWQQISIHSPKHASMIYHYFHHSQNLPLDFSLHADGFHDSDITAWDRYNFKNADFLLKILQNGDWTKRLSSFLLSGDIGKHQTEHVIRQLQSTHFPSLRSLFLYITNHGRRRNRNPVYVHGGLPTSLENVGFGGFGLRFGSALPLVLPPNVRVLSLVRAFSMSPIDLREMISGLQRLQMLCCSEDILHLIEWSNPTVHVNIPSLRRLTILGVSSRRSVKTLLFFFRSDHLEELEVEAPRVQSIVSWFEGYIYHQPSLRRLRLQVEGLDTMSFVTIYECFPELSDLCLDLPSRAQVEVLFNTFSEMAFEVPGVVNFWNQLDRVSFNEVDPLDDEMLID